LHYERHHAGIPNIDPARHRLVIQGMVERPLLLTVAEIKRLPSMSRILLVECGGNSGSVVLFDVKTGKIQYEERIGGGGQGFTASPVAANGKLYFTGELGDVFVLPATNKFGLLATNKLGGLCLSTPAISDGTLFFRTTEKLVAVGYKK